MAFTIGVGTVVPGEPGEPGDPGDPPADAEDDPVNSLTPGDQDNPAVATNANGDYVVVWVDNSVATGSNIVAQRYDNTGDRMPTPEMGARNFREQLPVVDPQNPAALTYGTFRISRDLQIWLVEGRLYRSLNRMADGPEKTIWGETQKLWLKETLLASDATFKMLISPTPLVGPDGKGKRDSHCNINGFQHEGQEFFDWLGENGFLDKNFYILCGDRHWQYHARHPSGFEEFSTGALVDANSRFGVKAGSKNSTDPEGKIKQFYCKLAGEGEPSGGFLLVTVTPGESAAQATFTFYDEQGQQVYSHTKQRL